MEQHETAKRRNRPGNEPNNRKIIISVLVTLLVMLLVYRSGWLRSVGFAPAQDTPGAQTASSPSAANAIESGNFSFRYPQSWKELTATELNAFNNEFIVGIKRSKPPALMWVKKSEVNGGEEALNSMPALLDKLMSKQFKEFDRLESELIDIDGKKALKYVYKFKSSSGLSIVQRQFIIINDNTAYYLIFHSSAADAESLSGDVDSIAGSFKLK